MKILLLQPPIEDFYRTSIRTQPIGLAYLASSLKTRGYDVEILDCQTEKKKLIPVPLELSYLRDFYPFDDQSPFKLYTGYYHFGLGWREIEQAIKDSKADVFGISSSFTPYHEEASEIARLIKGWDQKKIVVMGGAHVSVDPEGVLQSPFVDYGIMGEGEIRFPLLLEQIEKGKVEEIREIDGVVYRKDGEVRVNPLRNFIHPLDSLPHPARELLDLDRYLIRKKRSTMIITSRGCPHGCAYCSAYLVMGPSFRVRTPENVVKEMVECWERYGIQFFDIEDDNFTFDLNRAKRLMRLIVEAFGERKIELSAMNGLSFASMDKELLSLIKRAGFQTLNLSYVSTAPSTKERLGRPKPLMDFGDLLDEAGRAGLNVVAYAIFGMPGQTVEEMVNTLIYLMGKRVLIGPSIYYPALGTPLYKKCQKDNILPPHFSQWRSSAFPIETEDFARIDLVTLFRLARVINFIKEKMDKKELEEGMTWKELIDLLKDKDQIETKPWIKLVLLLFKEKAFFSLKKEGLKGASFLKERSSEKVLRCFFEKAWRNPILKSRLA